MQKIFIDGQHGTTGLEIHALLAGRRDVRLLEIDAAHKKDPAARAAKLNEADAVILCLPDEAAREAVALIEQPEQTCVIDASTAHRTAGDWVYGLPELPDQRAAIANATRVSNPGCYPTGFLLAVRPLVDAGLIPADLPLSINAVSGYSGGGRQMIEQYQAAASNLLQHHNDNAAAIDTLWHSRPYALTLAHKHVPEMQKFARLQHAPLFSPSVGHFYRGMLVCVPLHASQLNADAAAASGGLAAHVESLWQAAYAQQNSVRVLSPGAAADDGAYLNPQGYAAKDTVELMVAASADSAQMMLIARLDNLGKGAGGAAVQNLNLMFGLDEHEGLDTA